MVRLPPHRRATGHPALRSVGIFLSNFTIPWGRLRRAKNLFCAVLPALCAGSTAQKNMILEGLRPSKPTAEIRNKRPVTPPMAHASCEAAIPEDVRRSTAQIAGGGAHGTAPSDRAPAQSRTR